MPPGQPSQESAVLKIAIISRSICAREGRLDFESNEDYEPDYRYVAISDDRIKALPLDGDISSSFPTIVDDTTVEEELPVPGPLADELPPRKSQSMVLNLNITATEVDLMLQELSGRHPTPPSLPAPSIRQILINEASGKNRIFAMAFPMLYPTGRADFNTPHARKVALRDYA